MKTEKQIEALSNLMGYRCAKVGRFFHVTDSGGVPASGLWSDIETAWLDHADRCKYLVSRDAILEVLRAQPDLVLRAVERCLRDSGYKLLYEYMATASELAEALLRATGKWTE